MTTGLSPVRFDAPLVNPSAPGLWGVTQWTDTSEPLRWLPSGVEIRPWNYGFEESFGVWAAAWDAAQSDLGPEDVKQAAERPEPLAAFAAITTWAADECDLMAPSRDEARTRAAQIHRLREPIAVEAEFAARMLDDADTPTAVADLVAAVGALDEALAATNTVGFIHARPGLISVAAEKNQLVRTGVGWQTPSGHRWVFGGGYIDALGDKLVATSQPFGWRGEVALRTGEDLPLNRFHAIAERSLVIGYEALLGAVEIEEESP
ncbi:hypothetical protein [Mycolicibacterium pulveris]|uniref:hypothetical protein n=1 Tax=Mycolicibacterium pulveris TaxID=36813 RepID=UPI003CF507E6